MQVCVRMCKCVRASSRAVKSIDLFVWSIRKWICGRGWKTTPKLNLGSDFFLFVESFISVPQTTENSLLCAWKHFSFYKPFLSVCVCAGDGPSWGDLGRQHGGWVLPSSSGRRAICSSVDLLHYGGDQQLRNPTGTHTHLRTHTCARTYARKLVLACQFLFRLIVLNMSDHTNYENRWRSHGF